MPTQIRGPFPHFTSSFGIPGGQNITFYNYVATVPDHVADYVCQAMPDRFKKDRQIIPAEVKSVLVARNMGLGDVLLATPTLRALKKRGIEKVAFATYDRYKPLIEDNPYVDEVLEYWDQKMLPVEKYDSFIDLRMYVEHAENGAFYRNRAKAFGEAADMVLDDIHLDYFARLDEIAWANEKIGRKEGERVLACVWRSSRPERNFSQSRWMEYLDAITKAGWRCVIVDHEPQDLGRFADHRQVVNMCRRTSIRQSMAVLAASDVVLTPDTGLFHGASALDKPIVTAFGSFPLAERATHDKIINVVQGGCGLMPCRRYWCGLKDHTDTSRCMAVPVERIVAALDNAYAKWIGD